MYGFFSESRNRNSFVLAGYQNKKYATHPSLETQQTSKDTKNNTSNMIPILCNIDTALPSHHGLRHKNGPSNIYLVGITGAQTEETW